MPKPIKRMPSPIKRSSQVAKDNTADQKEIEAKLLEQQQTLEKIAAINTSDFEIEETVLKFDKKEMPVIIAESLSIDAK